MTSLINTSEQLHQLHAYTEIMARLAEAGQHKEVSIPCEALDKVFSHITDSLTSMVSHASNTANNDYGNLQPYVTFNKEWANGTTYQVRVPRQAVKECQDSGGSLPDLIDEIGEIA